MTKFENVAIGDKLLVNHSSYGDPTYYIGTVTAVTKTRFTVRAVCFSEGGQVFTKDGNLYPRPSSYGRSYIYLSPFDSSSEALIEKSQLSQHIKRVASNLGEALSHYSIRNKISDIELETEELNKTLEMLQDLSKKISEFTNDEV